MTTVKYDVNGVRASDRFGQSVFIELDSEGRLSSFTGVDGVKLDYKFTGSNLTHLMRGEMILRQYHYEDSRFPNALTGVTDERGIRYLNWSYDEKGRANSSQQSGVNKFEITYQPDGSTDVINPLGKKTTYRFQDIAGSPRLAEVQGVASSSCIASNTRYSYNPQGLVVSKTDDEGFVTEYAYNSRGLEIVRTEAVGTSDERTTSTEWHDLFRLPVRVVKDNLVTVFVYDSDGRLQQTVRKSL